MPHQREKKKKEKLFFENTRVRMTFVINSNAIAICYDHYCYYLLKKKKRKEEKKKKKEVACASCITTALFSLIIFSVILSFFFFSLKVGRGAFFFFLLLLLLLFLRIKSALLCRSSLYNTYAWNVFCIVWTSLQ